MARDLRPGFGVRKGLTRSIKLSINTDDLTIADHTFRAVLKTDKGQVLATAPDLQALPAPMNGLLITFNDAFTTALDEGTYCCIVTYEAAPGQSYLFQEFDLEVAPGVANA